MNNKLKAALVVIISFLGGIFYRMGGSGNFPRWIREAGQGVCFVAIMLVTGLVTLGWQSILGIFLGFGLSWLESTYFKSKGTDAKWWNWALVGAVFGVIPLPYCALTNSHWLGFYFRLPLCIVLIVFWQEVLSAKLAKFLNIGKDITDEFGRGFINLITLPLLLV